MMLEYLVVVCVVHDANIQLNIYIASDIFKKSEKLFEMIYLCIRIILETRF